MTQEQQPTIIDEEILWHRILTKGIFRKKVTEGLIVTNRRVIKELPQSGHLFTLPLTEIDSIQVVNQHRDSHFHMSMAVLAHKFYAWVTTMASLKVRMLEI